MAAKNLEGLVCCQQLAVLVEELPLVQQSFSKPKPLASPLLSQVHLAFWGVVC
jgi:hypothetical protein